MATHRLTERVSMLDGRAWGGAPPSIRYPVYQL
jgi:hypothetical protein